MLIFHYCKIDTTTNNWYTFSYLNIQIYVNIYAHMHQQGSTYINNKLKGYVHMYNGNSVFK